jgi:hypothetical protein
MNELLDYVERAGQAHMVETVEVAGMIQREANTLAGLMLAGAGAALGYAVAGPGEQVACVAGAVSVYLFGLVALLNWKCLGLVKFPASHNEPAHLNLPEYTLAEIRSWELENLQARIQDAKQIVCARGLWLNRCRYAVALTPVMAAMGWVVGGL